MLVLALVLVGAVEVGLFALVAFTAARATHRPVVESYTRTTYEFDGWTYEPGVEHRLGDNHDTLRTQLEIACEGAAVHFERDDDPEARARAIGRNLAIIWEDRAYFVEAFAPGGGWSQTFQPYGVPRCR